MTYYLALQGQTPLASLHDLDQAKRLADALTHDGQVCDVQIVTDETVTVYTGSGNGE